MLRALAALALAVSLTACEKTREISMVSGDSFLGRADAKVTLVEYASPTCPFCKAWHDKHWAEAKALADSGKVKFVFREKLMHNPPVDAAVFAIARCVGQADYFSVIDAAFAQQETFESVSGTAGGPRQAIIDFGKKFNLSQAQVETCIKDPANLDRFNQVDAMSQRDGVTGTPSFVVNGQLIRSGQTVDDNWTAAKAAIDAANAAP
jgi:protein-disulfide isomerase